MKIPRHILLGSAVLLTGCSFHGSVDNAGSPSPTASPSPIASPSPSPTASSNPTGSPAPAPPTSAATGAPSSAPPGSRPSTGSPSSAGPAPCATTDLQIGVGGGSGGAAGSTYTAVTFVNSGSTSCTLDGHPGVSYVAGDRGRQVGASARREAGRLSRVALAPGGQAHATLRIVRYQNFPAASCAPAPVRGLRVYPPDQTESAFVARAGTTCSDPSTQILTVGVVEAGPAERS